MTSVPFTERSVLRGDAPHQHAIPMGRLVEVELRKMVDTRAGRWLLIGLVALIALVLAIVVGTAKDPGVRSFANLVNIAQLPVSVLLPVLGVLAATSEWTNRTVIPTFSLVPSRGRSLAAKIGASLVLATTATLITFVLAAAASLLAPIAGSVDQDWSVGLSNAGEYLAYQWLSMLFGVALGTALLSSGLAIVLYFALPTIWGGITSAFSSLHDAQLWLDTGTSWFQLLGDGPMSGVWWERVLTTALLWIALPLAIGTWRVLRREVD
jgi:ABC-2 type transport system permease protein